MILYFQQQGRLCSPLYKYEIIIKHKKTLFLIFDSSLKRTGGDFSAGDKACSYHVVENTNSILEVRANIMPNYLRVFLMFKYVTIVQYL